VTINTLPSIERHSTNLDRRRLNESRQFAASVSGLD